MIRFSYAVNVASLFENGVSVPQRCIFLENDTNGEEIPKDEVHTMMANRFLKSMCLLEGSSKEKDITIYLNTIGGCEFSGLAIYDRIKESPCKTIIQGYGQIMSMGVIIMQAADVRLISPNAWVMMHRGDNEVAGVSAPTLKNWAIAYEKMDLKATDIILEKMRKNDPSLTKEQLKQTLKEDVIYTAEEAVAVGLMDRIHDGRRTVEA